jgi:uncharacterized ion transporter superfamily protein YfcC
MSGAEKEKHEHYGAREDDNSHSTGIPHVYSTLFLILVFFAAATWFVPAGEYDRSTGAHGEMVIMPGTYHRVEPRPVGPAETLSTVYRGMVNAADTVFFVFITFSSINVIVSTGVFHALITRLIGVLNGRARIVMIPIFITLIGLSSSTIAVFEEMFTFIPLFVTLAIAMKFDALVGMSIVALGIGLGYSGAFLNPFTVGIAQDIAGLPLYSGAGYRLLCYFVMVAVASGYVMIYAEKISLNPEKSLLVNAGFQVETVRKVPRRHRMSKRHVGVLIIVIAGIGVILWGVLNRSWFFQQLSAVYLSMGIVSGLVMCWSPDKIAHKWAEGASNITSTCIKIALAKGILLVLQDSSTLDTIIKWISEPLSSLPKLAAAEAMLIVQTGMNFFVPSGSGQALVSMPVMAPLSDLLGISRQTAVLAFQFGDGLSNILWITGSMPIICKFANVPPRAWLKWFIPLFAVLLATQMLCLAGAVAIGY